MNILALDWSDIQSQGAAKREKAKGRSVRTIPEPSRVLDIGSLDDHASRSTGTLDYKTVNITSDTLLAATNEWIHNSSSFGAQQECAPESRTPVPVLFVALHACGSLTLDILRAFVAKHNDRVADRHWTPEAAVIVGCCYNLLRPDGTHPHDRHRTSFINFWLLTHRPFIEGCGIKWHPSVFESLATRSPNS